MGYHTYYTLSISDRDGKDIGDAETRRIIAAFRASNGDAEYSLADDGDSRGDETSWYDHEKDVAALSKNYPGLVFVLYGVGEQNDDMWYKYFHNGKVQLCPARISFAKYNESKLKEVKQ